MSFNVIHGTGKPRIEVSTNVIEYGTITSVTSNSCQVTLNNYTSLKDLDDLEGIVNYIVYTVNDSNESTYGKITAYVDFTNTLVVNGWSNGTPRVNAPYDIQNIIIDLPYCESLIETFTPDFITFKGVNGKIFIHKRGFYYSAQLNYASYMKGTILGQLRPLYNKNKSNFTFYPRSDNLKISYTVDISPDEDINFKQAPFHQGHELVVINLIGVKRLSEATFYNPFASLEGYGYSYGTDYGKGI